MVSHARTMVYPGAGNEQTHEKGGVLLQWQTASGVMNQEWFWGCRRNSCFWYCNHRLATRVLASHWKGVKAPLVGPEPRAASIWCTDVLKALVWKHQQSSAAESYMPTLPSDQHKQQK